MNVTFSVPAYPQFRHNLDATEYRRHEMYLRQFERFAAGSLELQVKTALAAADKFAAGSGSAEVKLEVKRLEGVVQQLVEAASGVVERATCAVDAGMQEAKREIVIGVEAAVAAAVDLDVVEPRVASDVTSSEPVVAGGGPSAKTLANREKRHRRAALRRTKVETSSVPEWRRGAPVGAFEGCAPEVLRDLRESRAKMLVEKNKAETVRAEHERRKFQARMQARAVEQEVETARLRGAAEYDKLVKANNDKYPGGYRETLLSVGVTALVESDVPSLTSGSVSPNSSISVAELKRRNDALIALTTRVAELELQVSAGKRALKVAEDRADELTTKLQESETNSRERSQFYDADSSWDL